jgi:hypothetical protein
VTVSTFDTLKYANALKAAGVPEKQAEAQAAVLADALAVNLKDLVTKDDLKQVVDLLRADMNGQFTLLKWMVGALIPLVIGVLVRLLFFRLP